MSDEPEIIEEESDGFIDTGLAKRIEDYLQFTYAPKVKEPSEPTDAELSFKNLVGIKALLFTVSALGAAVFSSIRTGGYFFIVENVLLKKYLVGSQYDFIVWILSIAAFVAALFTFEGYALGDGFSKGEKKTDITSSRWGLNISLGVIMVVGVFSGLEIVAIPENVRIILSTVVAILTSLGAGAVAFFGGENIGFAFAEYKIRKQKLLDDYGIRYAEWRDGGIRSFNAVYRRFQKSKSVQENSKSEQNLNNGVQGSSQIEPDLNGSSNGVQTSFKTPGKVKQSDVIKDFIHDFVKAQGKLPSIPEIMANIVASKSTIFYAAAEYAVENADALVQSGLVSPEGIEKARESLDKKKQTDEKNKVA